MVIVLVVTPLVGAVPVDTVQPVDVVLVLVTSLMELPARVSGGVKVTFPVTWAHVMVPAAGGFAADAEPVGRATASGKAMTRPVGTTNEATSA